jgi:hypothetical protein
VLNDVARDARLILAREVRQSILKITPDVVAESVASGQTP